MSYKLRSHIVPEVVNDVQQSSWNHNLHWIHATLSSPGLEYIPVHRRHSQSFWSVEITFSLGLFNFLEDFNVTFFDLLFQTRFCIHFESTDHRTPHPFSGERLSSKIIHWNFTAIAFFRKNLKKDLGVPLQIERKHKKLNL